MLTFFSFVLVIGIVVRFYSSKIEEKAMDKVDEKAEEKMDDLMRNMF